MAMNKTIIFVFSIKKDGQLTVEFVVKKVQFFFLPINWCKLGKFPSCCPYFIAFVSPSPQMIGNLILSFSTTSFRQRRGLPNGKSGTNATPPWNWQRSRNPLSSIFYSPLVSSINGSTPLFVDTRRTSPSTDHYNSIPNIYIYSYPP